MPLVEQLVDLQVSEGGVPLKLRRFTVPGIGQTTGSRRSCQPAPPWLLPERKAHRSRSANWLNPKSG